MAETVPVLDKEAQVGEILKRYEPGSKVYPWQIKDTDIQKDALAIANIYLKFHHSFLPAPDEIMLRDAEIVIYDWEKAINLARFGEWSWMRLVLVEEATGFLRNAVVNGDARELKKWTGMLELARMLPGRISDDPARPLPAG